MEATYIDLHIHTSENADKLNNNLLKSKKRGKDMEETKKYLGKEINVKIDRPIGSRHPEYEKSIYPINYGYIPNTISGDGKEIDCYILGVFEKIEEFKGECIAIIQRLNDNENKLVVAPKGKQYTDDQIMALLEFQEQYFKSKIIRK